MLQYQSEAKISLSYMSRATVLLLRISINILFRATSYHPFNKDTYHYDAPALIASLHNLSQEPRLLRFNVFHPVAILHLQVNNWGEKPIRKSLHATFNFRNVHVSTYAHTKVIDPFDAIDICHGNVRVLEGGLGHCVVVEVLDFVGKAHEHGDEEQK